MNRRLLHQRLVFIQQNLKMSSIVKESRLSCYAFGGILLVKWIFVAIILLCVTPERSLLTCLLHPTFKRLFDISIDFSKFFAFIYCGKYFLSVFFLTFRIANLFYLYNCSLQLFGMHWIYF